MKDNDDSSLKEPTLPQTVTRQSQNETNSTESLFRGETKAVKASKVLVVVTLVIAAIIIGVISFFLLAKEEQRNFESQFHDYAIEISELVHHEAANVFASVEAFSISVTSSAVSTGATWPMVSLPHFEVLGVNVNKISNSIMIAFCPLVSRSNKLDWEMYAVKHQGWIEEGVNTNVELHRDFIQGEFRADPISETIFRFKDEAHNGGQHLYLPVWQLAPAPHNDNVVNLDLLSHPVFLRVFSGMFNTGKAILSEATDLEFLYGGSIRGNVTVPHSFLLQPVYKDIKHNYNQDDIVGSIIAILSWDYYFMNILSPDAQGILVVLEDTCDQRFTFLINGAQVEYIGPGDLHDPTYDDLNFKTNFDVNHLLNVTLLKEHCEFILNIYPTIHLEESFKTIKPALYTSFVIIIFLFTSMVFVVFDFFVQKRQKVVMRTTKCSTAIVSSLFPPNVRDQLMEEVVNQEEKDNDNDKRSRFFAKVLQKNNYAHRNPALAEGVEDHGLILDTRPIADLFPHATVMFADIAGFTSWCSVREPSQVFQLLETLYHAFDQIAKRQRVFKVETIGDCYVAVTGLPEPCEDHAVIMAQFAHECLATTNDLVMQLEVHLGPKTSDLTMRLGLNSGPVTAGVLRGERSRFQLFGETVDIAARMENRGKPGKIHVSKNTADYLCTAGKSHWVSSGREEKITVHGKGDLQTFWLEIPPGELSSSLNLLNHQTWNPMIDRFR